ncbi:VWA domain-containing protein [Neiella marina]|uniref:VWA domain-containing protein n=1 Tax=Neiella holothuriorum TaxID=2870530 RepID=A0ABS7EEX7_9GAMM|nr:VWA domain-containing protein [Neiella holothuriorum]MBW8190478.1 VWA domain-containing protein [Neiella holothuriorum]
MVTSTLINKTGMVQPSLIALVAACSLSLMACSITETEKAEAANDASKSPVVVQPLPEHDIAMQRQLMDSKSSAQKAAIAAPASPALIQTRTRMALPSSAVQYDVGRNNEIYQHLVDNGVLRVSEQPVSTFSADVDTASYANVRRWLEQGQLPPKDAVRTEELINYFHYQYGPASSLDKPIAVDTLLTPSPWNDHRHLLRIGVNSYQPDPSQRPAANIVVLVDVSGSMRANNKLPMVKQSLRLMLSRLQADDRMAIVTYANGAKVALPSTSADDQLTIGQAINGLAAGGSTNGGAGIELAYQQAQQGFIDDGINHILLMSDGDLNVGVTNLDDLKQHIEIKRQQGVHFSTIGFGQGNYNDELMEQLADIGNGMAGYIDSLHEAQKLLVDQLGSSLQVVAHDVKLQVEFNPEVVAEYRLVGYENRQLARADFNQDGKDAGDMGAGHSVTAIYELTLVGEPTTIEPLVFQRLQENTGVDQQTAAEIRVRYKLHQGQASQLLKQRINLTEMTPTAKLKQDDQFAFAVAAFAQKLRHSDYLANIDYAELTDWANQNKGLDPFGYRAEFVGLVRLAASLDARLTAVDQQHIADPSNHRENRSRTALVTLNP